jgi:ArsR family transcriptional regulator
MEMMIDEAEAIEAFAALSQQTRLHMVRALVKAGPEGLSAGAVGEAVGASSSGASFHLAHLERAGLIASRRESRSIIYSARFEAFSGLVDFLLRDCCSGHPEICAPAAAVAAQCITANEETDCAC